jgi:hypothetical protein
LCNYIEKWIFFELNGENTLPGRNDSILWQLSFIIISVINIIASTPHPTSPEFEGSLGMRLYASFYFFLHYMLPIFLQIFLCVSTLFNSTIFGWVSFVLNILVQFKPESLTHHEVAITAIFDICFIIRTKHGTISATLEHILFNDFQVLPLVPRPLCVYESAFNQRPDFFKSISNFISTFIFKIGAVVNIVISLPIPTFHAFFLFLLIGSLFFFTLFFGYFLFKTNNIPFWGTFFIFCDRQLSGTPSSSTKESAKSSKRHSTSPSQT